jgi:hypothetical protein
MLHMTDLNDRFTVTCSCGCFSLSFRDRTFAARGLVRCLACGARASVPALVRAWHAQVPGRPERRAGWFGLN